MALEGELQSMDLDRIERVVEVLGEQVAAGQKFPEMVTPDMEERYEAVLALGDAIEDRLMGDAELGQIPPPVAVAMARGAHLAVLAFIQYAEAEAFEARFSDPED